MAICVLPFIVNAQSVEVKGTISDSNGEYLPLANLMIFPDSTLTSTDLDGKFAVEIKPGLKKIRISYTGYETFTASINVSADTTWKLTITPRIDQLKEVVIQENRYTNADVVQSVRAGTQRLTQKDMFNMPTIMGEADLIKTLHLLPGNVKGLDGSSDVFVRGGAADQNLVLLDGAPIYNTSHLFGFMSVFNPDVVDNVEAINGGFPAEFGGRLSSVLNVNTLSLIPDKTRVSADVGLIASRVKLEQPIVKDKASFWISGRRTYVDKVMGVVGYNIPYYFYDVNGKLIFHPSKSHQIEISHYAGEDVLDHFRDKNGDGDGMLTRYNAGNSTQSLKWVHRTPEGWTNNLYLFKTDYSYRIKNAYEDYAISAFSNIEDYGAKVTLVKDSVWKDAQLTTGLEWTRHTISPNVVNSTGSISEIMSSSASQGQTSHELAAFIQQEWSLTNRMRVNVGLRGSASLVGDKYYMNPEPRLSARYEIKEDQALKFNYSRMAQYIHRVSNAAVSTPADIWYPVTDSIRPQRSHQYSLAWQRFLPRKKVFFSIEGYYKSMEDLIAYEEGTNLLFNTDFASKLIQGEGKAYGAEFLIRKESGKFTGWISYTLSWSLRRFDGLNNGEWFHARYDRRHNGAIVAQHTLGKRFAASMVWEYISGARFTPVIGQYVTMAPNMSGLDLIPIFAKINSVKLTDSHRLDLGIKFFSKPDKKFKWTWSAGIYNIYNRATPVGIVIEADKETGALSYKQPGLFGLLPYISYGCKF